VQERQSHITAGGGHQEYVYIVFVRVDNIGDRVQERSTTYNVVD
jgi:hypothetical protein